MNTFEYIIPILYDAPDRYDVTVEYAPDQIARRLANRTGRLTWEVRVYHDGQVVDERTTILEFTPDQMPAAADLVYLWRGSNFDGQGRPGFVESTFKLADDRSHFVTKIPIGNYALYSAPGRPSYRADGDYKFGSPPVISTVGMYGRVIDGYPTVRLDRERGYGESLACINPYGRPINVFVRTHDGRELPRQRVGPQAGIFISLEPVLKAGEERWTGRVQITANNRLVLYHVRHRFGDVTDITDHEHLDPYRADPTHVPATLWVRQRIGDFFKRRYGIRW
jgi:hypothetical protein